MAHAINDLSKRWPSGIVPYTIHPEVTHVHDVNDAINEWELLTNLRFVVRTNQKDYVEFYLDTGLFNASRSDAVGKEGDKQNIFLNVRNAGNNAASRKDTIMHEIGHAIGLKHEHQRSDRDNYVRPDFGNIIDGTDNGNFEKSPAAYLKSGNYDYESIMHYGAYSYAINTSQPTLVPVDSSITLEMLGRGSLPTATDVDMVNNMYPATGVIRRSASVEGAGGVKEIAAVSAVNGEIITAVKNNSNDLHLIRWLIDDLGTIQRKRYDITAGEASYISIQSINSLLVTSVRDGSGRLTLISWRLQNEKFERLNEIRIGEASLIESMALRNNRLLTACRDGSGNLRLITFSVAANGSFTRLGDSLSQAGEVSEINLTLWNETASETRVITSVRAGNGNVKVIAWAISLNGNTITRRGDSGEQIGDGTLIQGNTSRGFFIVSCKAGNGHIKIISLRITANGSQITRLFDSGTQSGEIRLNTQLARDYGVINAVRNGSGNLLLVKWRITRNTGQITRINDSSDQAGAVSLINLCSVNMNGAPLVTVVRNSTNELQLITWDDNPAHGEIQR
jgi:hypothetical protein